MRRLYRITLFNGAAEELGYIPLQQQSSAVTGTASITEGADVLSAAGIEIFTGTASPTETADTQAAQALLTISGSSSAAGANDTSSAVGVLSAQGSVDSENENDSAAASGQVVDGQDVATNSGGYAKKVKEIKAKPQSPKWKKKQEEERLFTEKLEMLYERFANGYVPEPSVARIAEKYIEAPISEIYKTPTNNINYSGIITNLRDLNVLISEYDKIKYLQDEEVLLLLVA